MQITLTLDRPDLDPIDLRITAREPVLLPELAALLPAPFGGGSHRPLFSNGEVLPARARLGDRGLRDGCVLSAGRSADQPSSAASVLRLKVTAGPDCGRLIPLHRGRHVVGRGAEADTVLADPDLSRSHICLRVTEHAVEIEDLRSTNGTMVDGEPLGNSRRRVSLPCSIAIGATELELATIGEPPATVVADGFGLLLVQRPPRAAEDAEARAFSLPVAPKATRRPRIQWLAALAPLVLSAVLAVTMRSVQLLAFVALSPVSVLASTMAERRSWRRDNHQLQVEYEESKQATEHALEVALQREASGRRRMFPDAAELLLAASTYNCRLWERRPGDSSFLALRLGRADQPAGTTVNRNGDTESAGVLPRVPATVRLTRWAVGVAAPAPFLEGLRRWLVGQALVLHSPAELSTVLLTDRTHARHWRWLRWLPAGVPVVASTPELRRQIADQLLTLMRERQRLQHTAGRNWSGRWTLVVIDPAELFAESVDLNELLKDGPAVGLAVLCFAREHSSLPGNCGVTMRVTCPAGTQALLAESGRSELSVLVDRVGPDWAEQLARSLACARDVEDFRPATGSDGQPRLSELLQLHHVDASSVRNSWHRAAERPSTPVGLCGSQAFEIDLVRDGPHLLIAGTTGSGKSELLRALIAGLAVRHLPDMLSFVLIDYKGGAAFADCAALPHVAGMVTDLDPQSTSRALASLNAELRRREEAMAQAGISEFADYQRRAGSRLARLVLVIDEFAALAEELPELLSGLLGVAQRGRSLGVHLVLATQRPAGVLSPDIKANMGLRIALRMVDAAESTDVIGVDAASRISRATPGRAIARHADGLLQEFQAAHPSQPARQDATVAITELDEWNQPLTAPDIQPATELTALTEAVVAAAAGMPRATPPWLEPLPAVLPVQPDVGSSTVVFGRSDEPARQRQSPVSLDLVGGGSIGFVGGPRSGRTTALRTCIGVAVGQLTEDQLHVYVIDCAGPALHPLRRLPHCGAVLDATDPAAVGRLIARLTLERQRRQQRLAELGVSDLAEGRRASCRLPAVLVALDGWEGLSALSEQLDGGRSAEQFVQLLRDGPAAGFTVLVTGDRDVLGARIAPALGRKLLLPLTDRNDYGLAGLGVSAIPVRSHPGRAVTADKGIEVQLGLLADDPATAAQWEALADRALTASTGGPVGGTGPAIRMQPLPAIVEAVALLAEPGRPPAGHCLLGVGRDDASVVACALLRPRSRFLIAGPNGSGKTSAARLIARQAQLGGLRVVVAATAQSPLAGWAADSRIASIGPDDPIEDIDTDLLLVDDAEQFTDTPAGDTLQRWIASSEASVVVTARTADLLTSFRGIGVEMRRHRCGLLLQPAAADGEIFGIRLGQLPACTIAGRGVLVTAETRGAIGGHEPIQVAA